MTKHSIRENIMRLKAEIEEENSKLRRQVSLGLIALKASMQHKLEHLITVYDDVRVDAYTYGLDRVDGGILVLRRKDTMVEVEYAEAWQALYSQTDVGHWHTVFAPVMTALQQKKSLASSRARS